MRRAFWDFYLARFPSEAEYGAAQATISRWHPLPGTDLVLALYVALDGAGIFVRGRRGAPSESVYAELLPHGARLAESLGVCMNGPEAGYHCHLKWEADLRDPDNWQAAAHWLHEKALRYTALISG